MHPIGRKHPFISVFIIDVLFLTVVLGSLFFIFLGTRPLFVPDEGRYAEIAREMVSSGNYLTPYLDGIKYFEKPILYYWLESAAIHLGGLNLWSLRSINALLALICCLVVYSTARQLYCRKTGLLAALILGTSSLFFVMTHMISLDLPVTAFLTTSLCLFLLGCYSPSGWKRLSLVWLSASAAALAVLTKGLIGIIFPIMIIGSWITLEGKWRLLKQLYLPSSLVIFLLITAPWHYWVGQQNPEFLYFYFIEQHFLRYTTLDIGHYQPAWFFLPTLALGFIPWIIFLPQTIIHTCRHFKKDNPNRFFLLWIILIFGFFSFSKSKLIPYILPIFPPLAILTADYLVCALQNKKLLGIKLGVITLCILSTLIATSAYIFLAQSIFLDPVNAYRMLIMSIALLLAGSVTACFFTFKNPHYTLQTLISTAYLFLVVSLIALPYIDTRSILPLANIIKPILKPNDEVITYNIYYQDLPFYLERKVSILNWKNELSYGLQHQNQHEWLIDDNTFWKYFNSQSRVFVLMGKEEYDKVRTNYPQVMFHLLGKTTNTVLISNQA